VIKDIATRYRRSFALTDKTATQMAREIQKIYDDPNCPLSWPKVLIVNKGTEYMGECRDLFLRHDAIDLHLPLTDRSREWVVDLHINDDKYNDSLQTVKHKRPIGYDEPLLSSDVK
ncbi:21992_t:CDS:2, partial [Dentiscutata erythropus]